VVGEMKAFLFICDTQHMTWLFIGQRRGGVRQAGKPHVQVSEAATAAKAVIAII
jgi:hypothetical protein